MKCKKCGHARSNHCYGWIEGKYVSKLDYNVCYVKDCKCEKFKSSHKKVRKNDKIL